MNIHTAARMALDALESLQGGCTDHDDGTVEAITVWCPEVITALRKALAAPQPEPVAWISAESLRRLKQGGNDSRGTVPVHATQSMSTHAPLYLAAPPAAPAPVVPLTDERIRLIYSQTLHQSLREQDTSMVLQFARAVLSAAPVVREPQDDRIKALEGAAKQVMEIVDLQRDPHWAYRNTVTTRRQEIREILGAALGIGTTGGGK